jgi:hypothetical protein
MKRLLSPGLTALCFALVLASTWGFGYRVASFETLLAVVISLLLAISVSFLAGLSDASRMTIVGLLFFHILATSFISSPLWIWLVISLGAAALGLLHTRLQPQFFVVCGLVFLVLKHHQEMRVPEGQSEVVVPASADADTQILVHWVMDEMGSFESIPEAQRVQAEIDEIRAAYVERGFRLYSGAPSFSPDSRESLGRLVDVHKPEAAITNVEKVGDRNSYRILRNTLHQLYAEQGWSVSITQSSYIDFCAQRHFSCRTYEMGKNAYLFDANGLALLQRAEVLGRLLFSTYLGLSAHAWRQTPDLSLSALSEMHTVLERAKSAAGKRYFFGHFLLPHFPWTLDKDCKVKPMDEWQQSDETGASKNADERIAATHAYWQQTYCTHKSVLKIVDALDAAHPGKVRFLIHGDHGPRIFRTTFPGAGEEPLTDQTRRTLLEPFIASRLESDLNAIEGKSETMQALLQRLLTAEAAVPSYSKAPPPYTRP